MTESSFIFLTCTPSLRRLQTDHVDVFLAHRWDGAIAMDELLRTFDRWIQSGKVRCVGSSNFPVWRIAQACEMSVASGRPKLQVLSPKYNLMRRGVELEQAACARHYGASLVSYQPLEAGVLSGKYRRDEPAPAGSRGSDMPGWIPKLDEATHDRLDGLQVSRNASIQNQFQTARRRPRALPAWAG